MATAYDLNLRHLRLLEVIAQAGSLNAAAGVAAISQPALTQALARLERNLGVMLFHRSAAGVRPTIAGKRTLHRVRRALDRIDSACRLNARASLVEVAGHLTMSHVRGLVSLAQAHSFSGAAELAKIATPSLHRAVRELERLMGVPLVKQRGRGIEMTAPGSKVARGFRMGLVELSGAIEETADGGGYLSIGAMPLSRSLLLPATLANLLQQDPALRVDVVEGSYLELVDLLRSGKIDILVGALRDHPGSDLLQEPLFNDRLTIIGRRAHPLADRTADFEDLAGYPWIVARRASGLLDRWQKMFDQSGKPRPRAPIQCASVALIRGLLVRSDFLTLLSRDQVSAEIDAGTLVAIASCVPDTMRTIGAILRRDWFPTKAQLAFLDCLKLVASGVSATLP